ncbi:30S ribosomal protein S6 [Candidatus Omnitrophota bacterium]
MNCYEGVFILKPDLSTENLDKTLGQIQEAIEKHKGSQGEIKDWGKQKLTYPVRKQKEGIYYIISFHIDPDAVSKIRRSFSLNESILRVLLVKK